MTPQYDLEKIKFSIDSGTWEKAVNIYESGKVVSFQDTEFTYIAEVKGTELYKVIVSPRKFTEGNCNCYLGQNDTLCKHMIAVAIYGLKRGKPMTEEEKTQHNEVKFNGQAGETTPKQLSWVKAVISDSMRYIKSYTGPSKIWFTYQDSLTEGCNRLAAIVSKLPANRQTAKLLINLLLRLDKKLQTGGGDDSYGTVGGFIEEVVSLLVEFAQKDPECKKEFKALRDRETCFGWEEPLLNLC